MKVGDKILVYGTLRPGFGANGMMEKGARHLRTTRLPGARMYNLGFYPGVRLSDNKEEMVEGDLYEIVDPELPSRLDSYEGYPTLYDRRRLKTECGEDAWVYVFQPLPDEQNYIPAGVWTKPERPSIQEMTNYAVHD